MIVVLYVEKPLILWTRFVRVEELRPKSFECKLAIELRAQARELVDVDDGCPVGVD